MALGIPWFISFGQFKLKWPNAASSAFWSNAISRNWPYSLLSRTLTLPMLYHRLVLYDQSQNLFAWRPTRKHTWATISERNGNRCRPFTNFPVRVRVFDRRMTSKTCEIQEQGGDRAAWRLTKEPSLRHEIINILQRLDKQTFIPGIFRSSLCAHQGAKVKKNKWRQNALYFRQ